ncbi:assimilatory sulfite reductase (NADPH) flavoprotein subunit [Staphylococcus auricularis]|uniref:assimilatory sulfite reductase (NADPH) flavoprotein subunit n=1 Tax=Staphylococcus auricularis TaxID=29379 RepID=UPI003EB73779
MEPNTNYSPLDETQRKLLDELINTLTPEQQYWVSGYLMGQSQRAQNEATASPESEDQPVSNDISASTSDVATQEETSSSESESVSASDAEPLDVTILFGTETGNAEFVAEQFYDKLKAENFNVSLYDMDDFKPADLAEQQYVFVICSTQGVGEPPINALDLYEYLHSDDAPSLEGVNFSVLALGDQDFANFCQAGKDFDHIIGELGAHRMKARVDCDFDYEETANQWMTEVLELLTQIQNDASSSSKTIDSTAEEVTLDFEDEADTTITESNTTTPSEYYTKANPFQAKVLTNFNLCGNQAEKEVRHIELEIEDNDNTYEPGDILGVIPENDPVLVANIIQTLGWDAQADTEISDANDTTVNVKDALTHHFEITKLNPNLVETAATLFGNDTLTAKVADQDWLNDYIEGRDFLDLVTDFPPRTLEPKQLTDLLRKLPPREYSIASSNKLNTDEVHITVSTVRYQAHGRDRKGVCSVQLAERTEPGDTLPIYFRKNKNFKFPFDASTPVIMVGAGTGIAPFRAYLQECMHVGYSGDNWLIFGNQYRNHDYLYQEEIEDMQDQGFLNRLDLAFSRDSEHKVYVQDRLLENSETVYDWLTNGACFFVCGDKEKMAQGVSEALHQILVKEGDLSDEEADHYLKKMLKERRYQRDVY